MAAALLAAIVANAAPAVGAPIIIGSSTRGEGENRLSYAGRWQFVDRANDGRYHGQSARSYHSGDNVSIVFQGTRLRIFGITGPNGGEAEISLGGPRSTQRISFFSQRKRTHVLLYTSRPLRSGVRLARLVVLRNVAAPQRAYVNVDAFEVSTGRD